LISTLRAAEPIPNSDCLQCHGDKELTRTNATGQVTSLFVDEAKVATSRHATNTCWSCHGDIGNGHPDDGVAVKPVDCSACHKEQSESYGASVHGIALRRGEPGVATCKDCHGGHDVVPRSSPDSPLNAAHQGKTCGGCHEQQSAEVGESVHGAALAQGKRDAPTCTDCHSEHKIEQLKGASSIKISERVCSQCHASERINAKYRMPADRVKTFLGSYHGLAAQLGSTRAANCASCHGVHFILPSNDPRSSIHSSHLVETCGKCHPGATENFAIGRIHTDLTNGGDVGSILNRWVRRVYLTLIVVVVGVLALHNALLWWRKAAAARLASLAGEPRMDLGQRWQHMLLAVSFILLAWSGFALKYPDSWASWLLGADETIRRWSHRGAAVVLVGLGLFHVGYVLFSRDGRRLFRDFLPRRTDLAELAHNARYMRGRAAAQPHGGRFGYAEKMEYWAVVWGTVIMGVTGFMIWFPVAVSRFLPRWAVDVATTIHYYEAILACLAILVWHFYQVVFDPDVYPLNWSFWTGRKPKTGPAAPDPQSKSPVPPA
jgi:cytochrome b subunit of formate dehydrogenase